MIKSAARDMLNGINTSEASAIMQLVSATCLIAQLLIDAIPEEPTTTPEPQAKPLGMPAEIWAVSRNNDTERYWARQPYSGGRRYIRYDEHKDAVAMLTRDNASLYDKLAEQTKAPTKPCPTCAKVREWCENEVDVYFNHTDIYQAHTILDILGEAGKVQPRDPMACPVPGCTGTMVPRQSIDGTYYMQCNTFGHHPRGIRYSESSTAVELWRIMMSGEEATG